MTTNYSGDSDNCIRLAPKWENAQRIIREAGNFALGNKLKQCKVNEATKKNRLTFKQVHDIFFSLDRLFKTKFTQICVKYSTLLLNILRIPP